MTSLFRYFDFDGDGVIRPVDLRNGLRCIAEVYSEAFSKQEINKLTAQIFQGVDEEKLTIDEFTEAVKTKDLRLYVAVQNRRRAAGGGAQGSKQKSKPEQLTWSGDAKMTPVREIASSGPQSDVDGKGPTGQTAAEITPTASVKAKRISEVSEV